MSKVALINVVKAYGKTIAVNGLDFEVKDGEFFCLLGSSGAGKTTTLRLISGVENPDRGDILIDGNSIIRTMPKERDVAFAFESYALYPQFTVAENLLFPLEAPIRRNALSKQERQQRVREVAELLEIDDLLDRFPKELSGGQRQRVGLGRALVRKPKVYLLDEPIAHLDAKLRHRMRGELKKIQSKLGITTIYSTPDQLEALSMADTILLLNKGKVEQVGTPDELFYKPKNIYVAKFIGDPPMNIFDASIEDGIVVVNSVCQYSIDKVSHQILNKLRGMKKIKVGIRPKDIQIVDEKYDLMIFRGKVLSLETLGETTVLKVEIDNKIINVKVLTEEAPSRNDIINLKIDLDRIYYFDSEAGQRIE